MSTETADHAVGKAAPETPEPAPDGPAQIQGLAGLTARLGQEIGVSSWRNVTQADINTFAELTGDEQWIHVDPERAASGPFGATVQHGFFTLGTATGLLWEVCLVEGFGVILNYGLNRVRFPAPLKVDSRYRMRVSLNDVRELSGPAGHGAEAIYGLTFEVESAAKPCCVAELVFRYYD